MSDRPNWDTGEVRLWIVNSELPYHAMRQCGTPDQLREMFEFFPGPRVDWSIVDWSWIFDQFEEDREEV